MVGVGAGCGWLGRSVRVIGVARWLAGVMAAVRWWLGMAQSVGGRSVLVIGSRGGWQA